MPPVPPQIIPRPLGWELGQPPFWAALNPGARRGLTTDRVLAALERHGQRGVAPVEAEPANAAVLVALFEEGGETRLVLTRRSSSLRAHRGEVSFPGGRLDPGETAAAAAVREAHEEVALDPAAVAVRGWLHPLRTVMSEARIVPVVATLASRPVLVASPAEVERVFDVPLAELAGDGTFHEERWPVRGRAVPTAPDGTFGVWFFEIAGELIWGATARMIHELLSVVLTAPD